MAVAVILDLLARPGSLAIGEHAGLVTAPRPLRALRRRVDVLRRYRELLRLARREGFGPLMSSSDRAGRSLEDTGVRVRRVLEDAGGVYIKLGQIAATRVDFVPPEIARELSSLQNRVPAVPMEEMQPVLEAELGAEIEKVFAEFDWEPLASASIGQTYRARLYTGEPVVVKVQRPNIHEVMERDLAALALAANVAQRRTVFGAGLRSGEVLDQFAASLREELDFRHEADAMEEMATAARLALERPCAERVPRILHAPRARPGAVRRLDPGRHRSAGRGRPRPRRAGRAAAADDDRPGARGRVLPRRSAPGQRLRLPGRHPRADRLRRGRPARSDPAGGGRRHPRRARAARRQPAARRHRTRRRPHRDGRRPIGWNARSRGSWPIT